MRPGETLYPLEHLALGTRHLPEPGLPWTQALGPSASTGRSRGLCTPHPAARRPHPLPSARPRGARLTLAAGAPPPAAGSSVHNTVNRRELPGGQSRSSGQSPWVSLETSRPCHGAFLSQGFRRTLHSEATRCPEVCVARVGRRPGPLPSTRVQTEPPRPGLGSGGPPAEQSCHGSAAVPPPPPRRPTPPVGGTVPSDALSRGPRSRGSRACA